MSPVFTTHLKSLCGLCGHGIEWLRLGSREHREDSVPADWQSATQQAGSLRYADTNRTNFLQWFYTCLLKWRQNVIVR